MTGRWLALLFGILAFVASLACVDPSDVITYANRVPTSSPTDPTGFSNPLDFTNGGHQTRLVVEPIAGVRSPRDTTYWGVTTFGKYVLFGNYEENAQGIFSTDVEDQRIGVFDTELKRFCEIDIDPTASTNAFVEWVRTASPTARTSKIFFEGIQNGSVRNGVEGATFGYLDASLDTDPCAGQWTVHGYTNGDMDAAAPAGMTKPCGGICAWDGLAVIDANTVVLTNYLGDRAVVAKTSATGTLSVKAVYQLPPNEPTPGDCYPELPVSHAVVDRRSASDVRIAMGFDDAGCFFDTPYQGCGGVCPAQPGVTCSAFNGDTCSLGHCQAAITGFFATLADRPSGYQQCSTDANCVIPWGICNTARTGCLSNGECPTGDRCNTGHCSVTTSQECATNANCPGGQTCTANQFDLHPCVHTCVQTAAHCSVTTSRRCAGDNDCPSGETCFCAGDFPQGHDLDPILELKWNGASSLAPVSSYFQSIAGRSLHPVAFDSDGTLWATRALSGHNGYESVLYTKDATTGEHNYYDPTPTVAQTSYFPPTGAAIPFVNTNVFNGPHNLAEDTANGRMYVGGLTVGRAVRNAGAANGWSQDAAFEQDWGYTRLPMESGTCVTAGTMCITSADCPSGDTCHRYECKDGAGNDTGPCDSSASQCPSGSTCHEIIAAVGTPRDLARGGSPPSLWTSQDEGADTRDKDAYIERVPLATPIPTGTTSTRPSVAWDGTRLLLVSWNGGVLKYRLRREGFWTVFTGNGWKAMPTGTVSSAGPAVIANPATNPYAYVFGRDSTGQVVMSTLAQSMTTCVPGTSCTWTAFASLPALPSGVTVAGDIAATFTGTVPWVAVRGSNGTIYATRSTTNGVSWSPWTALAGKTTDAGPSLTTNGDGFTWLAARDASTGNLSVTRLLIGPISAEGWFDVAKPSGVTGWATAPTIVSDGPRLRLFAAASGSTLVYQVINDERDASGNFAVQAWNNWRAATSGSLSTRQIAATNVNGDVNLVTYDTALVEQAVE